MNKTLNTIFFILLISSFNVVFAQEITNDVILETNNIQQLNIKTPQALGNKDFDIKTPQTKHTKVLYYDDRNTFNKENYSITKEKNLTSSTTIGTEYNSTIGPDSISNNVSLFSKYKKKKFSFQSAYKQNNLNTTGKNNIGTFSLTPEYKVNDYFSIKNSLSENLSSNQRKDEVTFSINPFKDDRMNLDLGAGQTYDNNTGLSRSQMNFSTKIKF